MRGIRSRSLYFVEAPPPGSGAPTGEGGGRVWSFGFRKLLGWFKGLSHGFLRFKLRVLEFGLLECSELFESVGFGDVLEGSDFGFVGLKSGRKVRFRINSA